MIKEGMLVTFAHGAKFGVVETLGTKSVSVREPGGTVARVIPAHLSKVEHPQEQAAFRFGMGREGRETQGNPKTGDVWLRRDGTYFMLFVGKDKTISGT